MFPVFPLRRSCQRCRPAELAARLADAYRVTGELTAQVAALSAQVEDLKRQLSRGSATSSKPPSSDSPYQEKARDRSLRERGKRRPGKQPLRHEAQCYIPR